MLNDYLIDFGLSDKEAKVYIALTKLELATANEISKAAGVNRSSTYVVLESLKKQGFAYLSTNEDVQKYFAASPEKLLKIAEDRVTKGEKIKERIRSILPNLMSMHIETKHKPKVMIYEGAEAVKQIYFDVSDITPNKTIMRSYENSDTPAEYDLPGFMEWDQQTRKSLGIKMLAICPDTEKTRRVVNYCKVNQSSDKIVLVPKDKFKFLKLPMDFSVFDDTTSFSSLKELFCIQIKDQQIADALKNLFDLAFAEAKRLEKTATLKTSTSAKTRASKSKKLRQKKTA